MVLFVLFFIVVVVVGFVSYFVGQQRIRDIAAFAAAHGLTVIGNDWDMGDCGFSLFDAGNRRYWHNVLRGQWNGLPVTYCDYSYVVSDGKNQNTVSFSNVIATLGDADAAGHGFAAQRDRCARREVDRRAGHSISSRSTSTTGSTWSRATMRLRSS